MGGEEMGYIPLPTGNYEWCTENVLLKEDLAVKEKIENSFETGS